MRHHIISWIVPSLLFLALVALPVHAASYQVADSAGLDWCNSVVAPGDTCEVAAGSYIVKIKPLNSGTSSARISYRCPSRDCTVQRPTTTAYAVDLRDRSHITIDGFRFEGNGGVKLSGPSSVSNILENCTSHGLSVSTSGGTDHLIREFEFVRTSLSGDVLRLPSTGFDERTTVRNGIVRGGASSLVVKSCKDCTVDNVKLSGAWKHGIEINGAENLTVKNSILMAATTYGEPGPFITSAKNVKFINNAFLRGWELPTINSGCGLTGTVVIRNNIFYHAGTGQPNGQLEGADCPDPPADWPPTLDVNYNAYVGSGNFDGRAFWVDRRDPVHAVNYYADGVPGFPEWQNEMGFDANSIVLDNIDFREASSQVWPSGRLWGETAPFWGAPVRCSIDNDSFDTSQIWIGGLAVGDKLEFEWDGIPRVITSFALGSGSAMDGCEWEVSFHPALEAPPPVGRWFLVYSASAESVADKSFRLDPDAAVIDRGDPNPSNCGHSIIGTRCDIGPSEHDPTGGPDRGPCNSVLQFNSDKVTVQWDPTAGALGHNVYRDHLAELTDGDGDGLPDSGFGWCMTAQDPDPSDTEFIDQEVPPPGSGYFYLTSCFDAQGEWGLGSTSSGLQRNVAGACP